MSRRGLPDHRYLNRELSWLAFNERVLAQAGGESLPILERAKFLAITSSNLDEFMMVRVGGLKLLRERKPSVADPAGMLPSDQLDAVSSRCQKIVAKQYRVFREKVRPVLESAGLSHVSLDDADELERSAAETRFFGDVFPVLSPQAVLPESFPLVPGLGVHVCVRIKVDAESRLGLALTNPESDEDQFEFALIPINRSLPRVIPFSGDNRHGYLLLEDLVTHFATNSFRDARSSNACRFA